MEIQPAKEQEFGVVRQFHHSLIDAAENLRYKPGWKKDIYPAERLNAGMSFQHIDTLTMYYEDTGWTKFKLFEYPL